MLKRTELDDLRVANPVTGAVILADLQRPDDVTRRFNRYGIGGELTAEDAARFQTAVIASAVLAGDVPADVRDNFARVRKLHLYGVLEYDFFTVAAEYALLVLEGALRLRFLSYYDHRIPVILGRVEKTLSAGTFDLVRNARYTGSSLRAASGRTYPLPVSGNELLDWARREGLLPGTRTCGVDQALSNLRNFAAHPVTHTVLMPPDSAATIRDVAEIVNKLWGHNTPDGRFFTGPLKRRPQVVALSPDGSKSIEMRIDQVQAVGEGERSWSYAVFLAVEREQLVGFGIEFGHRPGFQATVFPCEKLWDGTWSNLIQAIESGAFDSSYDSVEYLDRLFFIRRGDETIDPARSLDDFLALDTPPDGEWYAIVADSPFDAFAHVRDHERDDTPDVGACSDCFVRIEGRLKTAADAIAFAEASRAP
jgi:hypothetical protein